ncbi:MAG: vitamin K epoxide reductase family protein [Actinomycetota bacterium]
MSPVAVPRWAVMSTGILSLCGVGISTYLTIAHFVGTQILACSDNALVNCTAVTTSKQSYFLGMPVAVLGLAFYLVMVVVNSPWGWRRSEQVVHLGRVILCGGGLVFIAWLIIAEFLIIEHVCLWCTGVHVVTIALALVISRVSPAQLGWVRSDD